MNKLKNRGKVSNFSKALNKLDTMTTMINKDPSKVEARKLEEVF